MRGRVEIRPRVAYATPMRKPPQRRRAASLAPYSERFTPAGAKRARSGPWLVAGLCALAGLTGCATIGYEQVASASTPSTPASAAPSAPASGPASGAASPTAAAAATGPVILVVVDGLRRDVLARHLEVLADFDQVPPWPSGLALLADTGFRFARTDRAETTVPGVGFGPWTALATGHYAGRSGVPASRYHQNDAGGRLRSIDFTGANDAAHIFYGTGFTRPEADAPPALQASLGVPTLDRRAAEAGKQVLAIFDPFGHGATWFIPETSGAGVNALLMHPVGAAAAPLYDRGVRDAALDALHGAPDFDLMTLTFRSVEVESCLESVRRCRGHAAVADVQADALKRLDGHLWRVLRALQSARPERYKRATLLLVSPGGVADLDPAEAPVLTDEQLVAALETAAGEGCAHVLTERLARGELVFDGDSAAGLMSLRGAPIGRQQTLDAPRRCIDAGITALLADAEGPLAAAGWHRPDASVRSRVLSREGERVSAARAPRVAARIERALSGPMGGRRTGEAILVLRRPWVFDDGGPSRHGRRGGLEPGAIETAFLLASRALTDEAVAALRSQAVELVDVAPTVLRLLDIPAADLERPSLLAPDPQGRLVPLLADRSPRAVAEAAEGLFIDETAEAITFGLSEAASIWPPDIFTARIDDGRHAWDVDAGTFPASSPCTYTEDKIRRRWSCTVPRAALAPGRHLLAVRRAPAPDDDAPEDSAQEGHWVAVIEASPVVAAAAMPPPPVTTVAGAEAEAEAPAAKTEAAAMVAVGPAAPAPSTTVAAANAPAEATPAAEAAPAGAPKAGHAAEVSSAPMAAPAESTPAPGPTTAAPAKSAAPKPAVAPLPEERGPRLNKAELRCADAHVIKVQVNATDPLGLMRLSVFVGDSHGAGTPDRMPALATVDQALDGPAGGLATACAGDITGPDCILTAPPTTLDAIVSLPVGAVLLSHGDKAARLPAAAAPDAAALRTLFASLGGDEATDAPRRAFLGVEICNVAGHCTRHVLATDRAWRAAIEEGCP